MKTKMLLLVLVILGTNLVYTQTPDQFCDAKTKKKVLNKIKRQMNLVRFNDYLSDGESVNVQLTFTSNETNSLEVVKIKSKKEDLNVAIMNRIENHPIELEGLKTGSVCTIIIIFKKIPVVR